MACSRCGKSVMGPAKPAANNQHRVQGTPVMKSTVKTPAKTFTKKPSR